MEIRNAVDDTLTRRMDTAELRKNFLMQNLFVPGEAKMIYSYYDRIITMGIYPKDELSLEVDEKVIGADYLLERREMGIINIGGPGIVSVEGTDHKLENNDCLYIGMGSKDIKFKNDKNGDDAKFYALSTPAHMSYPTTKASIGDATPVKLGTLEESNTRTIYKYIHPEGIKSCQLVMGMTFLEKGNVWNTMPTHTHERRIEVYFYFQLPGDNVVFHYMGEPSETRHIVMRNEEAVLSPSWSIHSGVGTSNYGFIWGMAGENQIFTDMDGVAMSEIM